MILFGFEPRLIQKKQGDAHTGFSFAGTSVTEIHIKSLQKNDLGLAGMYYFPDLSVLNLLDHLNDEKNPSMDHFAQYLINQGEKVGFIKLDHYVHLGTPEEYQEFLYWKRFMMD
mgnify:CR=1 FL=1